MLLERAHVCQKDRVPCISATTNPDYNVFADAGISNSALRDLYISQVSNPPKAATKNVVLAIAGQQLTGDGSGITGQMLGYKIGFARDTRSRSVEIESTSLVGEILKSGHFQTKDTFVGLVFDSRFNYEISVNEKDRFEDGYFAYVISKLGPVVDTIYLAAHSRGGCLSMRLASRLAAVYPTARIIAHNVDGVCAAKGAILGAIPESEFGVDTPFVGNPTTLGYKVVTTDVIAQFPDRRCLAVRSFLSGDKVLFDNFPIEEKIRGFGHRGLEDESNSLFTESGFAWYTQSFHPFDHVETASQNYDIALNHFENSMMSMPCRPCGLPM